MTTELRIAAMVAPQLTGSDENTGASAAAIAPMRPIHEAGPKETLFTVSSFL
jgi:hypothetical protein